MRDSEGKHEDECWQDDARVGAAVFASEDAKEGPRAFAEKRPPQLPRDRARSANRRLLERREPGVGAVETPVCRSTAATLNGCTAISLRSR